MIDWVTSNQSWLFSGIGVAVIGGAAALLKKLRSGGVKANDRNTNTNTNTINITNNVDYPKLGTTPTEAKAMISEADIRSIKDTTRILFIDDDDKFKVVKILKNAGWSNTSIVKDVASLDDTIVVAARILFVDIQGVGVRLGFKDEGLGLAAAIKDKYPDKKVVIYSAEPRGERFHKALRKADSALEKNADPYEFQRLVEDFAGIP